MVGASMPHISRESPPTGEAILTSETLAPQRVLRVPEEWGVNEHSRWSQGENPNLEVEILKVYETAGYTVIRGGDPDFENPDEVGFAPRLGMDAGLFLTDPRSPFYIDSKAIVSNYARGGEVIILQESWWRSLRLLAESYVLRMRTSE